jgi:hypothetical protein
MRRRRRIIKPLRNTRRRVYRVVIPTIINWLDRGLKKVHDVGVWLQRCTRRSWGLR